MLAAEVEMAKQRMQEIQREMESVLEQLGEAKVDRHESSRAVRKAELIQNLKRLFGGVVSALPSSPGICGCSMCDSCRHLLIFYLHIYETPNQSRSVCH